MRFLATWSTWSVGALVALCVGALHGAVVEAPVLSPVPGASLSPIQVTVSSATPGAEVHVTTDGSEPTLSSPVAGAGIAITAGIPVVVRARAFAAGFDPSPVMAARYQVGPRVVAGRYHTLSLSTTGSVQSWGYNSHGQLGDGQTSNRWLAYPTGLTNAVDLAAGEEFSAAVTADGRLWTWGRNDGGMLGLGDRADRATPTAVAITGVRAVACGGSHLLVLMQDGTVRACGANGMGQVGDGTGVDQDTLQVVPGLTRIVQVAAGYQHSLALADDGTVWAWGINGEGQLGTGSWWDYQVFTPRHLGTMADVVQLAAGDSHTLFLRADGRVWATGAGYSGQLGEGSPEYYGWYMTAQPIPCLAVAQAVTVAAGPRSSMALDRDGVVWTWGDSAHGQSGSGLVSWFQSLPVALLTLPGPVADISMGFHVTALTVFREIWAWGYNGQLAVGDGTNADRTVPTYLDSQAVEPQAPTPTLAPDTGYYRTGVTVAATVSAPAEARWTWDGSRPVAASPLADDALTVPPGVPTIVRARGFQAGLAPGLTVGARYQRGARVVAGRYHNLAITEDGRLLTWGRNAYGQLGDGGTLDRGYARPVALPAVRNAGAGFESSVAVAMDGTVWVWGNNDYGVLGLGDVAHRSQPVQIPGITDATAVAIGASHLLVLHQDGTVGSTGFNEDGQLGDGTWTHRSTVQSIPGLTGIVAIAAGYRFSLALDRAGDVWAWGANANSQLGLGDATYRNRPTRLGGIHAVVAIAAGDSHSLFLTQAGEVWACGNNSSGQLGRGDTTPAAVPVPTLDLTAVVSIAAAGNTSMALTRDGALWAWGSNDFGQLGDGSHDSAQRPARVAGITATDLSLGLHAVVATAAGRVQSWGYNAYFQTGSGTTAAQDVPQVVANACLLPQVAVPVLSPPPGYLRAGAAVTITTATAGAAIRYTLDGSEPGPGSLLYDGTPIIIGDALPVVLRVRAYAADLAPSALAEGVYQTGARVQAGRQHSLALARTGRLAAWGHNAMGELGDGTMLGRSASARVLIADQVRSVGAGHHFSAAVTEAGQLWTWGRNDAGILGQGDTVNRSLPTLVADITDARAVAGGGGFLLVLTADGTVWTSGDNTYASLGDGGTQSRSTLARVEGPTDVVQIAAGYYHALALCRDGTVWSWGYNGHGQLATGDQYWRYRPVRVGSIAGVVAIAAGDYHSLFVKADGTVWACGYGGSGGLGNGLTGTSHLPVQASGLTQVVAVAAGQHSSMALTRDGRVWTWGGGELGQLGTGGASAGLVPAPVTGLSQVQSISLGVHALVATLTGEVWSWGFNDAQQVGDGSTTNRLTPYLLSRGLQRVPQDILVAGLSLPEVRCTWRPSLTWDEVALERSAAAGAPTWTDAGRSRTFELIRDRAVVAEAAYRYRLRWADDQQPWSPDQLVQVPPTILEQVQLTAQAGDDRVTEGLHPVTLDGAGSTVTPGTARGWRVDASSDLAVGTRLLRLAGGTGEFLRGDSIAFGGDGIDYRIEDAQSLTGAWLIAIRPTAGAGLAVAVEADTAVISDGAAVGYRLGAAIGQGATTITVVGGTGGFAAGDTITLGDDRRRWDVLTVGGDDPVVLGIGATGLVRAVGNHADAVVTTRLVRHRWSWTPVAGTTVVLGDGASIDRSLRGNDSDGWAYAGDTFLDTWGRPDGSYPVRLQVTDSAGSTSTDDLVVTVQRGSAPVAAGSGSLGSPGGAPVFFDARSSVDDIGIVDAWWDVDTTVDSDGDGTADNDRDLYGLTASWVYATAGTYQVRLTVLDGAGQQAEHRFSVTVGADAPPVVVAIPWQGSPLQPHPAISGRYARLKARAWGIAPYKVAWEFGDGSAQTADWVEDPRTLEATHIYTGRVGQPFQATVTVTDGTGRSASAVYRLRLAVNSPDTSKDIAVDDGLWALHRRQKQTGAFAGSWNDYEWDSSPGFEPNGQRSSLTGSALHAFGLHGNHPLGVLPENPYVETVRNGYAALVTTLKPRSWNGQADDSTFGNPLPDANRLLVGCTGFEPYELAMIMDALVASGQPLCVLHDGTARRTRQASITGRRFADLVRDMCDQYAHGQSPRGGWQYAWNAGSDNSGAQWGAIGCLAARQVWGFTVPEWVHAANRQWLQTSWLPQQQVWGYDMLNYGNTALEGGMCTSASGLVQNAWNGVPRTDDRWLLAESVIRRQFLARKYVARETSYDGSWAEHWNVYGTYALVKAMRLAEPTPVIALDGLVDWYADPAVGIRKIILDQQQSDGTWTTKSWYVGTTLATAWSVIMLSPDLFVARTGFTGNRAPVARARDLVVPTDPGLATAAVAASRLDAGSFDPDRNRITLRTIPSGPFPVGVNEVSLVVLDELGLISRAPARITVEDREAPVFPPAVPATITVPTDPGLATASAALIAAPAAQDNVGVVAVTASSPSLALGAHPVTWTARDAAGNTATTTQTVVVVDREAPHLAAPAAVVARLAAGADNVPGVDLGTPTSSDNVAVVTVASDAPATFPAGLTTVTWTAADAAGNRTTATQAVVVVDARTPMALG